MAEVEHRVFLLTGRVQHYSWGGYALIPRLLGIKNETHQPFAEYWLGAHPTAPASIEQNGAAVPLHQLIAADKKSVLGTYVTNVFQGLPFLLKILDVRQMLSIQVHPEKVAAQKAFEEENKKGIPLTAAHRNYKDANHKPELMVALSDFWLLHGFRPQEALQETLTNVPELSFLAPYGKGDYKQLYHYIMTLPQAEVNKKLEPLVQKILPQYEKGQLEKHQPHFWAAQAAKTFCKNGFDRGLFSIYLFNLLHLKKGEGIYQPAGMPHAYLEGQNVEIMANSDNVLRAGLTDKHTDVAELLQHVHFAPTYPKILHPSGADTSLYPAPVAEFQLYQYELNEGTKKELTTGSAEIWLVLHGGVLLNGKSFASGQAAFILADTSLTVLATTDTVLFRAVTPVPENVSG